MTTYTTIANTEIDQDSPVTQPLMTAMRDNPIAISEGSTGAPITAAGWHPYDMVAVGDGNDGLIYDNAVDGNVLSIETPNFADGYEYMLLIERISHNTTATAFDIDQYFETAAAYQGVESISAAYNSGDTVSGFIHFHRPRYSSHRHFFSYSTTGGTASGGASSNTKFHYNATAQKVLKARIDVTGTSLIDGGKVYLLRRKDFF